MRDGCRHLSLGFRAGTHVHESDDSENIPGLAQMRCSTVTVHASPWTLVR